jgi:glyoxylase-like metal-dependent hydrolase (beta-lactamase superfamily II)
MERRTHRFDIGRYRCYALSDGTLAGSGAASLLPYGPSAAHLERSARRYPGRAASHGSSADSPTCLLVITDRQTVLVDTGAGYLEPTAGRLIDNLRAVGVSPGSIDLVVLTHGHPDHIGGIVDARGDLAFPNARVVMWRDEWDFWTMPGPRARDDPRPEAMAAFARRQLLPLRGRGELIEHEAEIADGIQAVAAPGHTPGLLALEIRSGDQRLLRLADVIAHPLQVEHPEVGLSADMHEVQAVATRRRLLQRAASERALVSTSRLPFPGVGQVVPVWDDEGHPHVWSARPRAGLSP